MIKQQLTESKFQMWRGCIAVITLDGTIAPQEDRWFNEKIKYIAFTDEQLNILKSDLKQGVNLDEVIPKITKKSDLAFLLYQVRVLGYIDGDYSEVEREAFKTLEAKIMKNIDIEAITEKVMEMEKESYHEEVIYKVGNEHSTFEYMLKEFLKFINPGDYKFPND